MRAEGFRVGSPEQRAARLEALRRSIARGEYHVPVEEVADAVWRAWRRGPRGPSAFGLGGRGPGAPAG